MQAKKNKHNIDYPVAPHDETIDTYFGHKVSDIYRPLENDTSAQTREWVEQENKVTRAYIDSIPFRGSINKRLTELNNYAKKAMPSRENDGRYYWYENDGLKNQSVLFRGKNWGVDKEVFLDPNKLSDDGTVALTGVFMSPDGRYTAYTVSRSGSDWTEIYVMDTETMELLEDHIEWAKFTGVSWFGDGFFYNAYQAPEKGKEFSNANTFHRVFFHKLGTSQQDDVVVFEDLEAPLHFHSSWVNEDGTILAVLTSGQGLGNGLKIKDLTNKNSQFITIEASQDYEMMPIDVRNGNLIVYTSLGAPNYRVVSIPLDNPADRNSWVELIPEQENVLIGAQYAGEYLLASYFKDATSHVELLTSTGEKIRDVSLPGYGTTSFSSSSKYPEVFYTFVSFTTPSSIYQYDINTGDSSLIFEPELNNFSSDDYITEFVRYPSKDGTMIPMYLTYKRGLQKDKSNPVYLYGYGGFNISLNPSFSANRLLWLENGGIYAQANLRGGGEYGEPWHIAGTKLNKQNVFDDFIAAAEYLIKEGWTTSDLMTIEGGSNGGLLVGAVTNQRPELFRVAIPRVGVMDMMRYHLFTIGWNWAPDYGTSADSKEMAEYLLKYSPIHNIKNNSHYPAVLVTTADHDDRVVPAHSFKYAATLQAANTGSNPKLIRIDTKAGHGAGKPISKTIDEWTDIYSFIFNNIAKEPKSE